MPTIRENLIAAKALIDTPEKWGKGSLEPRPGCYCALGALWEVGENSPLTPERGVLRKYLPAGFHNIPGYNDHPDTTHADIMALFDRAIGAL